MCQSNCSCYRNTKNSLNANIANLLFLVSLLQFGREGLKETTSKAAARTVESARAAPWASAVLDCVDLVRREKTGNPLPFKAKNRIICCMQHGFGMDGDTVTVPVSAP